MARRCNPRWRLMKIRVHRPPPPTSKRRRFAIPRNLQRVVPATNSNSNSNNKSRRIITTFLVPYPTNSRSFHLVIQRGRLGRKWLDTCPSPWNHDPRRRTRQQSTSRSLPLMHVPTVSLSLEVAVFTRANAVLLLIQMAMIIQDGSFARLAARADPSIVGVKNVNRIYATNACLLAGKICAPRNVIWSVMHVPLPWVVRPCGKCSRDNGFLQGCGNVDINQCRFVPQACFIPWNTACLVLCFKSHECGVGLLIDFEARDDEQRRFTQRNAHVFLARHIRKLAS